MAQKDSFFLPDKKQKNQKVKKDENREVKKKAEYKTKRNKNLDQTRDNTKEAKEEKISEKKPFDKKAYRLKKYSKKYKLKQFEEQRKKKYLRKYHKILKNETPGSYKPISFDEDTTDSQEEVGRFVRHPDLIAEDSRNKTILKHKTAESTDEGIQHDEAKKMQEEKTNKYAAYLRKKQDRFRKLSMKNQKGQPVMALRLELLLEKLHSQIVKK